jgi:hypothetical protein
MNLRNTRRCLWGIAVATMVVGAGALHAGGPLIVGGPGFGVEGQPFVWDNTQPIRYWTDGGSLGPLDNSNANSLVAQAFQTWGQVPTAALTFTRAGSITGIADGNVNTLAEVDAAMATCNSGSQTPIIYDDNASLLLQLTGDDSVVGVAGPCALSQAGKIRSGFAIFKYPSSLSADILRAVIVHELGHLLGLDHTDVRVPFTGTVPADIDATPTMYYMLITPLQRSLGVDDIAWISKLYPSSNFASTYGRITGHVLFSDGQYPAQDVLVVARAASDIHATVVAGISGYRFTGNPGQPHTEDYLPCEPPEACSGGTFGYNRGGSPFGSRDPSLIGYYELPVPPGTYTIEIRMISGGEIGPIDPPLSLPGPEEYWNTDESANDPDWTTETSPGLVTVTAGQTVGDIDIILNGTGPPFDIFEHGSLRKRDGEGITLYAWRKEWYRRGGRR